MTDILGVEVRAGARTFGYVNVTTLATGNKLRVPLHVVAGAEAGPTLFVGSTSHGDEIATIVTVRELLASVSPETLRGTLIAVPVMNLQAFESQTPFMTLDSWWIDEAFPVVKTGQVAWARGWASQQLASTLATIIDRADYVIDLHSGTHNTAYKCVPVNTVGDPEYAARVSKLSAVFGMDALYPSPAPESSLASYCATAGRPVVTAELGGSHPFDQQVMQQGVRGILNVMKHLSMLPGSPEPPNGQLLFKEHRVVRTKHGGMFYPEVELDALGSTVPAGQVLGRVVHPLTLQELEVVEAPYERTRLLMLRGLFSTVHPGDVAYIVGNEGSATPPN